ncbi:MAG: LysR family transcriptional regulator, partial [Cyanobacteria bacterium J06598_3]
MNIFHLEVLAAVAEQGSFSEAALRLEVSQSAVSRAVAALEN